MDRAGYLATLAAGAATTALPTVARAQAGRVRIGAAANDSYAVTYFAQDGGFFERARIDPDIQIFTNAQAMVQAAAGNAIDVGMADLVQVANAFNHGVPLGFIAPAGIYDSKVPTTLICVAKNSPIRSAKDLENQPVAVVAIASIGSVALQEWIKQNGADVSKVKLLELPFSAMAPALTRGTIAAAAIAEPFLSLARDDVRSLGDAQSVIAKQFFLSGSFASRDWVAANRDVASRLVKAFQAAAVWSNAHHDDTAVILAKYAKLDLDKIRTMARATFATTLDPRMMQPILDIAYKYGQMQKPVRAADLIIPA
jgi:NitT/TauT family transport system substrate-binding protein